MSAASDIAYQAGMEDGCGLAAQTIAGLRDDVLNARRMVAVCGIVIGILIYLLVTERASPAWTH